MRYYEAIYIVHPNIEHEELDKLIGSTKASVEKRKREILYVENLGKKRLAYPIQKQRFGTYIMLQFRGDGAGNARLNQDLELEEKILAHMIVRIEEDEVREARPEEPGSKPEGTVEKSPQKPKDVEPGEGKQVKAKEPDAPAEVDESAGVDGSPPPEKENPEPEGME